MAGLADINNSPLKAQNTSHFTGEVHSPGYIFATNLPSLFMSAATKINDFIGNNSSEEKTKKDPTEETPTDVKGLNDLLEKHNLDTIDENSTQIVKDVEASLEGKDIDDATKEKILNAAEEIAEVKNVKPSDNNKKAFLEATKNFRPSDMENPTEIEIYTAKKVVDAYENLNSEDKNDKNFQKIYNKASEIVNKNLHTLI